MRRHDIRIRSVTPQQRPSSHLAKVEFGVLLRADTFNLKQRGVGTGVALPPLVPKDAALAVETMYQMITKFKFELTSCIPESSDRPSPSGGH